MQKQEPGKRYGTDHDAFEEAENAAQAQIDKLLNVDGDRTIIDFHRSLGKIVWDKIGIARNEEGLKSAIEEIRELREELWQNVKVPGEKNNYNKYLLLPVAHCPLPVARCQLSIYIQIHVYRITQLYNSHNYTYSHNSKKIQNTEIHRITHDDSCTVNDYTV